MRAFSVAFGAKPNLDVAPSCTQRREVNGSERRNRNGRSKRRGTPTRRRILRSTARALMRALGAERLQRVMRALAATRSRGQLMRRICIRLHVRADRLRVRMTIKRLSSANAAACLRSGVDGHRLGRRCGRATFGRRAHRLWPHDVAWRKVKLNQLVRSAQQLVHLRLQTERLRPPAITCSPSAAVTCSTAPAACR